MVNNTFSLSDSYIAEPGIMYVIRLIFYYFITNLLMYNVYLVPVLLVVANTNKAIQISNVNMQCVKIKVILHLIGCLNTLIVENILH